MKSVSQTKAEMYIRQAVPETYRQVLKEIRQKEIYKLIIDTNPEHIQKLFRAVSTLNYLTIKKNIKMTSCFKVVYFIIN